MWVRGVGRWPVVGLVVFAVLVGAGETVLGTVHPRWPQAVVVGLSALAGAVVGLVKPSVDAVSGWWSAQVRADLDRRRQAREVVGRTAPGRRELQMVAQLANSRAVLGIHQAIPLPAGANHEAALSAELPLYVPRDVHARVTTWITAKEQSGGFLLLVGPAGAGKTRCLYEALKDKVPDAAMLIPADAKQVADFVDADAGRGLVVVWLNEIYDLLGPGKLSADLVRRMLNHTRPILIVATIWTERFEALTTGEASELSRDAREILTVLCEVEHLAARFSAGELERAGALAGRDPRLHEALESGSAEVVGVLAAKPRLLAYWQDPPDPYAHAVLAAAVTAVRCGHGNPVPVGVLEPLAGALLSPAQKAKAAGGGLVHGRPGRGLPHVAGFAHRAHGAAQ